MSEERQHRLHPLHTPEAVAAHLASTGYYMGYRRTGRSTVIALRMIAACMEKPYQYHFPHDHHGTKDANLHLCHVTLDMVARLWPEYKNLWHFNPAGPSISFGEVTNE